MLPGNERSLKNKLLCGSCREPLGGKRLKMGVYHGIEMRMYNYIVMPCCNSKVDLIWSIN